MHLDDFGTGAIRRWRSASAYSAGRHQAGCFVRGVNFNPVSQSLVRAIIAAAEALAFRGVIAEGGGDRRAKISSSTRSAWTKSRAFCLRNAPGTAGALAAVLSPRYLPREARRVNL